MTTKSEQNEVSQRNHVLSIIDGNREAKEERIDLRLRTRSTLERGEVYAIDLTGTAVGTAGA
jgi:hypothetical protein